MLTTSTPRMPSVPCPQKSWIRKFSVCSESTFFGGFDLDWKAFLLHMAQTELMRSPSRKRVDVRALLSRSATPLRSLLWRDGTRPPFFQPRACLMLNMTPYLSHWWGRSGGSMTYWSNASYLYYWYPSSIPFTVDVAMESHAPVLLPRQRRRISISESPPTAAEKASSEYWLLYRQIYFLPPVRICAWSPEQKFKRICRYATRCLVTTHYAIQVTFTVWVGSGISSLAFLTGNTVIVQLDMYSVAPWKR